jgi:predicted RNA binding protein YcfA (HicA-like mRNA interferase family)
MKVGQLKQILRQRGYIMRPGKGSHSVWHHPASPRRPIVLHGRDSDDAHPYLVARVYKGGEPIRRLPP